MDWLHQKRGSHALNLIQAVIKSLFWSIIKIVGNRELCKDCPEGDGAKMIGVKKVRPILAIIIYCLGLLLGLGLSGWYVWGEVEASLFIPRTGEVTLTSLKCPLMIGANETGLTSATFRNPTMAVIHPTVTAQISHGLYLYPRSEKTVLDLAPGEIKRVYWQVSPEDRTFRWLILVNVYETPQPNTSSQQGSCGILYSPLRGISGGALSLLIAAAALLGMVLGQAFWRSPAAHPKEIGQNPGSAVAVLTGIVALSMLFILPRWWVLSGFFFFAAIMLIGIIFTEFVLFSPVPRITKA